MAIISCPECGKGISDKADACIHCGYPLRRYRENEAAGEPEARAKEVPAENAPEAASAAGGPGAVPAGREEGTCPAEKPESASGKKEEVKAGPRRTYNGRLAIAAFVGANGSYLLNWICTMLFSQMGVYGIMSFSVGNSVFGLLNRVFVILLIIAFFRQAKALNIIAIGYEVTISALLIAIPGTFARIYGVEESLFQNVVVYLRGTGILWILVSGLCVLLGFVIRRKKLMLYFIVLAAVSVLAAGVSMMLVGWFGLGTTGMALFNLSQPFQLLLPLLLLNPDREESGSDMPRKGEKQRLPAET